jgi:type IV secretion system protein VirB11
MLALVENRDVWAGAEFTRQCLDPIMGFLKEENVTEILINRPNEVFVERLGDSHMQAYSIAEADHDWIERLCYSVAGATGQEVNKERPILSATLPSGERFQCALDSVAPEGGAISIRKQVIKDMNLDGYEQVGAFSSVRTDNHLGRSDDEATLGDLIRAGNIKEVLRFAVQKRISIVVSGGTATGKTTFFNALLKEIPEHERLVTIEDARELRSPLPNTLSLLVSKGDQGMARVTAQQLLEASLRMRPDRILLGELRGAEAFTFLQAVNTGHPGSITSVHANTPRAAYQRLALMVMQSGVDLTQEQLIAYLEETIPLVVQLARGAGGKRYVSDIHFTKM